MTKPDIELIDAVLGCIEILKKYSSFAKDEDDRETFEEAIELGQELVSHLASNGLQEAKRSWSNLKRFVDDSLPYFGEFISEWMKEEDKLNASYLGKPFAQRT
jgi:hypothetical protein